MKFNSIFFLMLFISVSSFGQGVITLDGYITDPTEGQPLSDALVYLEGSTSAIITNEKGAFSLSFVSTKDSAVVFSRVGFKKATYAICLLYTSDAADDL